LVAREQVVLGLPDDDDCKQSWWEDELKRRFPSARRSTERN